MSRFFTDPEPDSDKMEAYVESLVMLHDHINMNENLSSLFNQTLKQMKILSENIATNPGNMSDSQLRLEFGMMNNLISGSDEDRAITLLKVIHVSTIMEGSPDQGIARQLEDYQRANLKFTPFS